MRGGRSSGKSFTAVEYLVMRALQQETRILACREIQGSIKESVHKLISDTITRLQLQEYFQITQYAIRCVNGSEFIFAGLFNNVDSIKSMEGIDICYVEEAHNVSQNSWDVLLPTIRKAGSEFVIVFNPRNKSDATWTNFIENPMPDTWSIKVNYTENPYNSQEVIELAEHCKETDLEAYDNIWLGNPLKRLKTAILADKLEVMEFDLDSEELVRHSTFHGLDFGYSNDPTAYVRCHILDNVLYVDYEGGSTGLELNSTAQAIRKDIPDIAYHRLYCDCAQPAMISLLSADGLNAQGCDKWSGSITDGIGVLRSFHKIVVHPRCVNVIDEIERYSWKVDKNTDEILNVPVDANNHWIDAMRYALNDIIKNAHRRSEDGWASNQTQEESWTW